VNARTVVVAHREVMVAEGIAAALGAYPAIVPTAVATSAEEAQSQGERADAVALDQRLSGAEMVAARLRRQGVRVVLIGNGHHDDEQIRISTRSSVAALAAALVPGAERRASLRSLTPRQHEILSLVAGGLPAKKVARQLGISQKTVEHHKARIFAKLNVANQTEAVSVAMGVGGSPTWSRSSI